jgi:hypothetical protein
MRMRTIKRRLRTSTLMARRLDQLVQRPPDRRLGGLLDQRQYVDDRSDQHQHGEHLSVRTERCAAGGLL